MGRLNVKLPQQLENHLEERAEETGLTKSEITRSALVEALEI